MKRFEFEMGHDVKLETTATARAQERNIKVYDMTVRSCDRVRDDDISVLLLIIVTTTSNEK